MYSNISGWGFIPYADNDLNRKLKVTMEKDTKELPCRDNIRNQKVHKTSCSNWWKCEFSRAKAKEQKREKNTGK
jgi:hypothetical protein